LKLLTELSDIFGGERRASVSREISKIHEETRRGTLEELKNYHFLTLPRGEFVIIVAGLNF